ncbi:unnamed protein product [Onchocerca flexuosa]|uniref:Uncharacterized protein n=1 Tax=Onchocerca flexuosa TaxID=387005 RepID=A0A183I4D3_9BILA|nr:unnamed protein product [Onchocerca flexuosa]
MTVVVCCCVPRSVPPPPPPTLPPIPIPPPPPPTLPSIPIPPPVCCQISTRICCQPLPQTNQPLPVCCLQTSQVPQQSLFPPQPIPMLPSQIYPSPQIGRQPCCNCCSCFGSAQGRKRRSHSFLQYKLTTLK